MKKLPLITKILICLVIGISIGVGCRTTGFIWPVEWLVTFRNLFSDFLSFVIPLIIIGLIIPGIASLGDQSGKSLLITTILAYASTITAGILAFMIGQQVLPMFIGSVGLLNENAVAVSPLFTIEIPPLMSVMSALVFAFLLGIGLSSKKVGTLLKMCHEFSDIMMALISRVIVPLVPFYIGAVFAELSYSGEVFQTIKSFLMVYLINGIKMVYLIFLFYLGFSFSKTLLLFPLSSFYLFLVFPFFIVF